MPCPDFNPAFAYNGELSINSRLLLKASFAQTMDVWLGTFNPNPPLNEFEALKVSSLDYGSKYQSNKTGKVIYTISGEFSNFIAGNFENPS
jgi:hypothetical protein